MFFSVFSAYSSNETETSEIIKSVYKHINYLIDPHTAVGVHCAIQYRNVNFSNFIIIAYIYIIIFTDLAINFYIISCALRNLN